jgi:hypothetical protein
MSVVILSPAYGFGTGLHIPWFAAGYAPGHLANAFGITERGRRVAEQLLKDLCDYAQGRPSGWGLDKIGPDGQWTPLPPRTNAHGESGE